MSFRDQREHLQHKTILLERQLEEERQRSASKKKQRRKKRIATLWLYVKRILMILLVLVTVVTIGLTPYVAHLNDQRELAEGRKAHRRLLERMRDNVPTGVPERTWLWCVDHCARFGSHGSSNSYAEGVVTDTFLDYRDDPPTRLVTLSGPWMNWDAETSVSHAIENSDLDPPEVQFTVGDVVRITKIEHGEYTFRLLHPEL